MPFKRPHHISEGTPIGNADDGYDNILPKDLNIVWGNDPRYWRMQGDSAELIQVSWLEVSGKVNVKKGNKYKVTFQVSLKNDAFGWNGTEVLVMAKVGKKGTYQFKEVTLGPDTSIKVIPEESRSLVITVDQETDQSELHFGLYEVWSGKWKGGLQIHKARVQRVTD